MVVIKLVTTNGNHSVSVSKQGFVDKVKAGSKKILNAIIKVCQYIIDVCNKAILYLDEI